MRNYCPRVSLSYQDISGVVQEWSETCEKMVVYEHQRDAKVNRTHCHMLLINCKYKTPEALKRQFHSRVKTTMKGNELWSWESKYGEPNDSFIKYMTKGTLAEIFSKNYSPAELEGHRLQWQDLTPKGETLLTEKKESSKSKYDLVQEMLNSLDENYVQGKCTRYLADYLVSVVLNVLRKNRIVIGRYKVREYRDALMYYKDDLNLKFTNFVNEDIKDDY